MKILKGKKAKAKNWHDTSIEVEGQIVLIDHKTLKEPDFNTNKNGYWVCIEDESNVKHIVCPDTIELID